MRNLILLSASLFVVNSYAVRCADFSTQAEAQYFYNTHPKEGARLDRDKDGEACECLPGGSAYGNPKCNL